jgi:DNA-binding IclR family transcriptional regulator
LLGVGPSEAWRLIRKIGWDSVPAVRCTVLDFLARAGEPVTHATIAEATDLPQSTASRVSEDLTLLRLAKRRKEGGTWHVTPSEIALRYWGSERPPATSEGAQSEAARAAGEEDA